MIEGKLVTKYVVGGPQGYVINAGFGKVEWGTAPHDALWFGHAWSGTKAAIASAVRLGLEEFHIVKVSLRYHNAQIHPLSIEKVDV